VREAIPSVIQTAPFDTASTETIAVLIRSANPFRRGLREQSMDCQHAK
jgi:hypothetical protein